MQSSESFYHPFYLVYTHLAHYTDDFFLHNRLTGEEPLDELSIDEAIRFFSLAYHTAETSELVEWHISDQFDFSCNCGLQAHQEVLVVRVDNSK